MPSERTIKMIIRTDGTTSIETSGFPDNSCIKATKSVEELLGLGKKALKPEGHVKAPENQQGLYVGKK